MSKKLLFILLSLAGSTSLTACASGADDGSSSDAFRGSDTPFWNWRPNELGNGAVALHDGDGPLIPDCIIWDIDGGEDVYEGPAASGNLLLSVADNEVVAPDGTVECRAEEEGGLFKLRDAQGTVLYTVGLGRYIFEGDVSAFPPSDSEQWQTLLNHRLAYEVYGDQIFEGRRWRKDVLVTGDVRLWRANPMRKLLFAALAGAECGSNGPFVPPPPPG